jgi:hypothetical protein
MSQIGDFMCLSRRLLRAAFLEWLAKADSTLADRWAPSKPLFHVLLACRRHAAEQAFRRAKYAESAG